MRSPTTVQARTIVIRVEKPDQARDVAHSHGDGLLRPHLITVTEVFSSSRGTRFVPAAKIHELEIKVSGPNVRRDGTLGKLHPSARFYPRRRPADEAFQVDGPLPSWVSHVVSEFYPEVSEW